jgi:spermidine synthase
MSSIEVVRTVHDGERALVLRRRDAHLELVIGNVVLLSDAALETERAFGALAGAAPGPRPRILVGGLGFGATLVGALAALGDDAEVQVAERVAGVAEVARDHALAAQWTSDPRARVIVGDVAATIAARDDWSAILLDVDNGPEWASFRDNAKLYTPSAVAAIAARLRPGGIFAVWSGYPADGFTRTLRGAGLTPEIVPLREGPSGHERVRARAYVGRKRV